MKLRAWSVLLTSAFALASCDSARTTTPGGGDRAGSQVDSGTPADGAAGDAVAGDAVAGDAGGDGGIGADGGPVGADAGPGTDAGPGADAGPGGSDALPGDAQLCLSSSECSDGDPCNGAETCDPNLLVCRPGTTYPPDGTECDRDNSLATRDLCLGHRCAPSTCGDGWPDLGANPPEQCDDGNRIPGDGCDANCSTVPMLAAFRMDPFEATEPHLFANLGTCSDVTSLVNAQIAQAVLTYQSNTMLVFEPLDQTQARSPARVVIGAMCMASGTTVHCSAAPTSGVHTSTVTNTRTGASCYTPDPSVVNAAYTPPPAAVPPPCFASVPRTIVVNFFGLTLTLNEARLSAVYSGVPAQRLLGGVLVGFVTEDDAKTAIFPPGLPPLSGTPLYQYLSAGGAPGSSCNLADDRDTATLPNRGPTRGFWFHFHFDASKVDWSP